MLIVPLTTTLTGSFKKQEVKTRRNKWFGIQWNLDGWCKVCIYCALGNLYCFRMIWSEDYELILKGKRYRIFFWQLRSWILIHENSSKLRWFLRNPDVRESHLGHIVLYSKHYSDRTELAYPFWMFCSCSVSVGIGQDTTSIEHWGGRGYNSLYLNKH